MNKRYFWAYKNAPGSGYIHYTDKNYTGTAPLVKIVRIGKRALEKLLAAGPRTVIITGDQVNTFHIVGGWHLGFQVEITSVDHLNGTAQNWAWYNACHETGYRPAFYIEE